MDHKIHNRFWAKVRLGGEDDCWPWQGSIDQKGYGRFGLNGKNVHAHRVAYLLTNDMPDDAWVLHHCDNPPCCNPRHLFLGDSQSNVDDMCAKGRHVPVPGALNGRAKVSAEQASAIRQSASPSRELAAQFGISTRSVRYIRSGEHWR